MNALALIGHSFTFPTFSLPQFLAAEQLGDIGTTLGAVQVVSLLVGVILPILVGIVTKHTTSGGVKAILLALLSAVSGILTEYLANPDTLNWAAAGLTWLATFLVAVATYFGVWRPTGVAGSAQALGSRPVRSPNDAR